MISNRKHSTNRLSVWLLIFSLLMLTAAAAFSVHATPLTDHGNNGMHEAGRAAGDMARDAANGVGDMVEDAANGVRNAADSMANGEGGSVADNDGVIGNEGSRDNAPTDTQGKAGQIALIVVIVAIVIAVIIIVLLIPRKKKD